MSQSWDDYADGWDSNEDVRAYSEKAFETLLGAVELKGLEVLDFGCGTGILTEKISPLVKKIVSVDNSKKMIAVLEKKRLPNVQVLEINLTRETVDSHAALHKKFDLIVASSVCAFLENYEKTLGVLKSLLKKNSLFIQWDWMKSENDPDFGFTRDDIVKALDNSNFEVISVSEAFTLESEHGAMKVLMGIGKNV